MRFFYFKTLIFISLHLSSLAWAQTEKASFAELHVYPFFEKAVDQKSQFIVAAGVTAVFLVNPADDQIRADWKNHHHMAKNSATAA